MGELRKVQQTPTGTFFICLPRDWAKGHNLKKGSQVNLDVSTDGKLFVDTQFDVEPQPKVVSLQVGPYLSREIIGHYLLGYDVIRVEAKDRIDSVVRNQIKSTANSLAGLMLVEETTTMMTLQCMMQQPFTSPKKLLQRNQGSAALMVRDAASSFINRDTDMAKNVIERDVENNKFYFLLVRILRTIIQNPRQGEKFEITPIECLDYRLAASLIEDIGDVCVQIATTTLSLNDAKLSDEVRKLLSELQYTCFEANEQAFKSFLNKNIALAENVRSMQTKIEAKSLELEDAAKNSSVDLMPQILVVRSFLKQIYAGSVDMADLVV
ncbi:MAG: phosphate uptake regulator PhoU [Nitrososphaerota archaeon]|jgi:phosphate uptake regulator|uniref:PhoU domain-containing protein n=1 Tax=Candidatus Bathycorpusculum sp. TaxID=2994959 RepID=UPI00282AF898|nr:phosphate uptake regulator PhoU [Candidatus Termitimicrobium sp.]MCL2431356.1 phosphate uptake regulator PhoU [Candidatus Termitimicrobium sp.]MDR0493140.1 phosphate uptake regulator PhoU [Nitrososphaerota archaeon]